jgi:cell division protein FtsA
VYAQPAVANTEIYENKAELVQEENRHSKKEESTENKIRRSFFDRYVDKIKDFLDNAE